MRITRSSTRVQASNSYQEHDTFVISSNTPQKRKPEEADVTNIKTLNEKRARTQPKVLTKGQTLIPIPSSSSSKASLPLLPAVLTFSCAEAKNHLISVDRRFTELFSKMRCKPYEHLEQVHPFRIHQTPTSFFPSPEEVAKTDIQTLRSAGLSQRKAEYVLDLANRFADGRLTTEKLVNADEEELAKMLIEVRGIGRWTVDMFAIFSLRRPDILPVGDLGVQRGLLIWFLSLHSPRHNWGFTPQKTGASSSKKGTVKAVAAASDPDELPTLEKQPPISSSKIPDNLDDNGPTSDISSTLPTTMLQDGRDEIPSIPQGFPPSIKKTLYSSSADDESFKPIALPAGLTVDILKSRLDGKKKIKGAFLTPKEMEDLTERWRPYRSLVSPELMHPPLSPSDLSYSSPPFTEHSSPTESDTLQTPFLDHCDLGQELKTRICTHGDSDRGSFASGTGLSQLSQLFEPPSPVKTPPAANTDFSPYTSIDYGSPMSIMFEPASSKALDELEDLQSDPIPISLALSNPSNINANPLKTGKIRPSLQVHLNLDATLHSPLFPSGHRLNPHFVRHYQLEDELGSGGYGFVMTARHRLEDYEVAVKFIIKDKVPDHAWMEDETIGRLPTEVMLLSFIEHENIVKCLDLFEDHLYFYLIQELHGSPWPKFERNHRSSFPTSASSASLTPPTPALSPSVSTNSLPSSAGSSPALSHIHLRPSSPSQPIPWAIDPDPKKSASRPEFSRRPSHDLFECIEQSEHKRLSERQARYVFSQVVDAVHYLDSQGVTHRDIKDENLVIDQHLKVKLIDFGSAAVADPSEPRPYYSQFYGTTAYASPEILLKKKYQAPPAEIWTLGVLLSYLLTGTSPFPTLKDAINGRIVLADIPGTRLSRPAMSLMRRCLDPNPETRATIAEVKAHRWFA
ncbi:hypothetical protein H0H81_006033 [Sphagnurus paluster]|uniref:Protein kinase domain-containing protein n=1 Tax=Sphagnurus paluster TaxID=117069 RepID=A0A9P7FVG8_9AGAR|nr:hypothetical protein H0H81_006033 [Sphagnurus paluster]